MGRLSINLINEYLGGYAENGVAPKYGGTNAVLVERKHPSILLRDYHLRQHWLRLFEMLLPWRIIGCFVWLNRHALKYSEGSVR